MNTTPRYFDFERLDAYRLAVVITEFVAGHRHQLRVVAAKGGEQLERATSGALTNLCSGASARGAEQKRHFRIAHTEASEIGGALKLARIYDAITESEYVAMREIALRLCACLAGLAR